MNKFEYLNKKAMHLAFIKGAEVSPLPKIEPKKHRRKLCTDTFSVHKKWAEVKAKP